MLGLRVYTVTICRNSRRNWKLLPEHPWTCLIRHCPSRWLKGCRAFILPQEKPSPSGDAYGRIRAVSVVMPSRGVQGNGTVSPAEGKAQAAPDRGLHQLWLTLLRFALMSTSHRQAGSIYFPVLSGQKCNASGAGCWGRYSGTTKPPAWVRWLERVLSVGAPHERV